ncbi:AraC family transcriptional regulator [Candidatus Aalborgicola defluviihabitans]|uniref:AraC family transcriptional regulator n=1 Tax=Candidatus Aalborgicola defluviihabitans TaxID=3386187 RepID=UPI001D370927|nr:helix-turn-helix transcriptional regulator [Burkholderiales bacterium]MBK6567593.1 helix-turn-helix transcriptional regulator [Burkholderiales bacterium]MBK7282366.1 helix-turn-helix transcriptional regulator [Burkholderiales bacterium]MBK7314112.1 helix-turn-helix transcriptional regulator [Burkholderiales bacterium]MBL0245256.1 helix-turn-helix transcriptional regulator [Rhodoferax sp.]
MSTSKRKVQLTTVGFDNSANRAPTPQRPVRSRARSLAMDAHIAPHQHPWSQFTFCASGLMQVTVTQEERQTTYIVPSTRAVWIPPQVQHHVVVLETAELRTVDLDPCVTPKDWTDCKVLVVSKLLRELVHALEDSVPGARDDAIMALSADEMARATTQALGVPMPHPEHGDKRLRALCEAVLRNPADKTHLRDWVTPIGASERTVARLFRDELGTNFQQWRQQAILAHALPLLARGMPISQVAAASGYASDSAFSAMFKLAMGKAPRTFSNKSHNTALRSQ